MSKELTPLKAFNETMSILNYYENMACRNYQTIRVFEELGQYEKTIETALKRLERLEEEKQSFDVKLEKKLKALEIIKDIIKQSGVDYMSLFKDSCLIYKSPQEYELLKEVLQCIL